MSLEEQDYIKMSQEEQQSTDEMIVEKHISAEDKMNLRLQEFNAAPSVDPQIREEKKEIKVNHKPMQIPSFRRRLQELKRELGESDDSTQLIDSQIKRRIQQFSDYYQIRKSNEVNFKNEFKTQAKAKKEDMITQLADEEFKFQTEQFQLLQDRRMVFTLDGRAVGIIPCCRKRNFVSPWKPNQMVKSNFMLVFDLKRAVNRQVHLIYESTQFEGNINQTQTHFHWNQSMQVEDQHRLSQQFFQQDDFIFFFKRRYKYQMVDPDPVGHGQRDSQTDKKMMPKITSSFWELWKFDLKKFRETRVEGIGMDDPSLTQHLSFVDQVQDENRFVLLWKDSHKGQYMAELISDYRQALKKAQDAEKSQPQFMLLDRQDKVVIKQKTEFQKAKQYYQRLLQVLDNDLKYDEHSQNRLFTRILVHKTSIEGQLARDFLDAKMPPQRLPELYQLSNLRESILTLQSNNARAFMLESLSVNFQMSISPKRQETMKVNGNRRESMKKLMSFKESPIRSNTNKSEAKMSQLLQSGVKKLSPAQKKDEDFRRDSITKDDPSFVLDSISQDILENPPLTEDIMLQVYDGVDRFQFKFFPNNPQPIDSNPKKLPAMKHALPFERYYWSINSQWVMNKYQHTLYINGQDVRLFEDTKDIQGLLRNKIKDIWESVGNQLSQKVKNHGPKLWRNHYRENKQVALVRTDMKHYQRKNIEEYVPTNPLFVIETPLELKIISEEGHTTFYLDGKFTVNISDPKFVNQQPIQQQLIYKCLFDNSEEYIKILSQHKNLALQSHSRIFEIQQKGIDANGYMDILQSNSNVGSNFVIDVEGKLKLVTIEDFQLTYITYTKLHRNFIFMFHNDDGNIQFVQKDIQDVISSDQVMVKTIGVLDTEVLQQLVLSDQTKKMRFKQEQQRDRCYFISHDEITHRFTLQYDVPASDYKKKKIQFDFQQIERSDNPVDFIPFIYNEEYLVLFDSRIKDNGELTSVKLSHSANCLAQTQETYSFEQSRITQYMTLDQDKGFNMLSEYQVSESSFTGKTLLKLIATRKLIEATDHSYKRLIPLFIRDKVAGAQIVMLDEESNNSPKYAIDTHNTSKYNNDFFSFGYKKFYSNDQRDRNDHYTLVNCEANEDTKDNIYFSPHELQLQCEAMVEIFSNMVPLDMTLLLFTGSDEYVIKRDCFKPQEILRGKCILIFYLKEEEEASKLLGMAINDEGIRQRKDVKNNDDGFENEQEQKQTLKINKQPVIKYLDPNNENYDEVYQPRFDIDFRNILYYAIEFKASDKLISGIMQKYKDSKNVELTRDLIMFSLTSIIENQQKLIKDIQPAKENTEDGKNISILEPIIYNVPEKAYKEDFFSIRENDHIQDAPRLIRDKIREQRTEVFESGEDVESFEVNIQRVNFAFTNLKIKLDKFDNSEHDHSSLTNFDDVTLSEFVFKLQDYKREFMSPLIIDIIEFQNKTAKPFHMMLLVLYTVFNLIPLLFYLVTEEMDEESVKFKQSMLSIAFIMQCVIFFLEILQIRHEGIYEYFADDYWNILDTFHSVFFAIFFVYQVRNDFNVDQKSEENALVTWLTLFLSFFKILFFMRIFESMQKQVQMLTYTIQTLVPFILFYIWSLLLFSFSSQALEVKFDPEDYSNMNFFTVTFIQTFRNSIGDIATPELSAWSNKGNFRYRLIMSCIWVLWFTNIILNMIILLNFLIAQIGQVYEQVVSDQTYFSYKFKSDFNREYFILLSNCPGYHRFFKSQVIKSLVQIKSTNKAKNQVGSDEAEMNLGIVNKVKKNFKKSLNNLRLKIDKRMASIEQKLEKNDHLETQLNIKFSQLQKSLNQSIDSKLKDIFEEKFAEIIEQKLGGVLRQQNFGNQTHQSQTPRNHAPHRLNEIPDHAVKDRLDILDRKFHSLEATNDLLMRRLYEKLDEKFSMMESGMTLIRGQIKNYHQVSQQQQQQRAPHDDDYHYHGNRNNSEDKRNQRKLSAYDINNKNAYLDQIKQMVNSKSLR